MPGFIAPDYMFRTFDEITPEFLQGLGIRAILADKSREGFTAQIRELLQKYGASKLSEVDAKHYKALIADVEGLSNG